MNNFVECLYCGARYRGTICSKCNHAYIDGEIVKLGSQDYKSVHQRLTPQDFDEITHVPISQKKIKIIQNVSIDKCRWNQEYYFANHYIISKK